MHPPTHRQRGIAGCCLVAVAVLAVAIEVYAHWNPRRYLSLWPVAGVPPTVAVVLAVPVLLAATVLLTAPAGRLRTAAVTALLALLVPGCCIGFVKNLFRHDGYQPVSVFTTAASPDGRWVILGIAYRCTCDSDGYYNEFHLRSRAGWLSREAPHPLAVVGYTVHKPRGQQLEIVRIALPGDNTIEMYTNDGALHRTSFDPADLTIADQFEACGEELTHLCP
ncbi:hypothetical protein [Dactylosporangium sp. CA-139066]|uniref:hypothetical protein n=1 Tax=Dactylosporangium sp. CA-139066 TaxID=3239930 RepID=UPI003D8F8F66